MNSPLKLNYETRPIKFTERKMLLASLIKICAFYQDNYQYIGFGGLSFTDFKLFHKELHINNLISIEGGNFNMEKLKFNSPYSFIKIIKEHSTEALLNCIDVTKKSLIWLDYDGELDNYMFEDIQILFSKLPIGSIYLITCNRELKDHSIKDIEGVEKTKSDIYSVDKFYDKFGDIAPFGLSKVDFSGSNNYKTIRTMILNHINNILVQRNKNEKIKVEFNQLYNLKYEEHRSSRMLTFGGIITEKDFNLKRLRVSGCDIINFDDEIYDLKIPNLTLKEIDFINKHFDDEEKLIEEKIVTKFDIVKYKKTYKYLPSFFDVRL
jgi:hypothetical protein